MVDCSHEIRKWLLLGRKTMTNLDSVLKSKDITLQTKIHIVKAIYGLSSSHVWMWELGRKEGWAPKIDAFELWCWRILLRVPWTARRSNQSILKEINPEYSLEGLMLKPKLKYSGHLMWRENSLEKTLMLGKIEGRRRGWQSMRIIEWHHWFNGHELEQSLGNGEGQGLECCSPWGHNLATEQQQEQQCLSLSNGSRDDLSSYLLAFCNKGHWGNITVPTW